jgi:hypothetical protein
MAIARGPDASGESAGVEPSEAGVPGLDEELAPGPLVVAAVAVAVVVGGVVVVVVVVVVGTVVVGTVVVGVVVVVGGVVVAVVPVVVPAPWTTIVAVMNECRSQWKV